MFSRNFTNKLNDVLEITKAAFTEISVQNWENYCKHVINVEEEYTRKDIVINQEMDRRETVKIGRKKEEGEGGRRTGETGRMT